MKQREFQVVVEIIDGTHVRIVAPHEYEHEYKNRKTYHSVNVQIVFDASYRIFNNVTNFPGSAHDARTLNG